jgi:DNA (cytosine-5)-methyltransferase 1
VRELSLFSGAGGGLLASLLLGHRTVGYVEWDDYCQRVIAARIRDGYLPNAPIFCDINSFISDGFAASYTGLVDLVTAGFPCQPFSVAGKMEAADDARNGWPATIEVVRIVQPEWVFLENVPGLVTGKHGYFGVVLKDLACSGYDAAWRRLSAAEMGAPHKRDRVWIVAHANSGQRQGRTIQQEREKPGTRGSVWAWSAQGSDANGGGLQAEQDFNSFTDVEKFRPHSTRLHRTTIWQGKCPVEPSICRVSDGVAAWVGSIRAIGNGQVPVVAAAAWDMLTQ